MTLLISRIGNLKVLIPLFFFLFLGACIRSTPEGENTENNPNPPPGGGSQPPPPIVKPWEQLPHIDIKLIQPAFYTTVTNTAGAITLSNILFNTVETGNPIIFRPSTGNFDFLVTNGSTPGKPDHNTLIGLFTLTVKVDPTSKKVEAHLYLNGKYEPSQTTAGASIGGAHAYYNHIRPENERISLTDTWYIIYVFQGTDGKDYQYRTPVMSVANAL